MKVCAHRFNLYFALATALALLCGCQTGKQDKKPLSALRVHIEVNTDNANAGDLGTVQTVSVLRSDPVAVTIAHDPILTEANVVAAAVINAPGGFAIEIRFDENGTWLLEQYSASNPGKHFAIFGLWGEKLANGRWLAAPIITHRIANGVLAFTPDASREEADEFVSGLNNAVKRIQGKK
jgi:preprotein translocase subunit SecD